MKIVILDRYSLGDADLTPITMLGDCILYDETKPGETLARCAEADVVITNKVVLNRQMLEKLLSLRMICVAATGTNNIDMEAAAERGIPVRNVPGYSTGSVVEATFALLLGLRRHVEYYDNFIKSGGYTSSGRFCHVERSFAELDGKWWGIIGMGQIGHRVAQTAQAFGAQVCYYSTSGKNKDAGYPCLSLDELMHRSDVISLHAPLNPQTYHLISADVLRAVRPSALLINVARGDLVDESAVVDALNENRLAGYAADVFSREPLPADSPFFRVDRPHQLLLSPHNAWASSEARRRLVQAIAGHIQSL